jgi:hypothetical protein
MSFLRVPTQDPILKVGYLKLPHWCTSANVRLAWKISHRETLAYFVASKKFYYINTSYLFSKINNFTRNFCHNLTNSAPIFFTFFGLFLFCFFSHKGSLIKVVVSATNDLKRPKGKGGSKVKTGAVLVRLFWHNYTQDFLLQFYKILYQHFFTFF